MKRISAILAVSLLVAALGAGTWLLTALPGLDDRPAGSARALLEAPAMRLADPLTDPDTLVGALGPVDLPGGWISHGGQPDTPPVLTITESGPWSVTLELELPGFRLDPQYAAGRRVSALDLPDCWSLQVTGLPEVPVVTAAVGLPASGAVTLTILEHVVREMDVPPVIPSRGHVDRPRDPATVPPVFSDFYATGGVWPTAPAVLGDPFLLRERRGVNVRLQPLRWDAARERLIVSERLVVRLEVRGASAAAKSAPADDEFGSVYGGTFAGSSAAAAPGKYAPLPTRGRMLIVSDPAFAAELEPLRRWKLRLGIETEILTTDVTGRAPAAIGAVLQARYDEPAGLTWVILVGDYAQIPPITGLYDGSDSDSRYALLAGDDEYPDVFLSRISAETAAQVRTQVAKFIAYEREPVPAGSPAWYARAAGVASDEGVPADYERVDDLRGKLLEHGFHTVDRLYQNLGGSTAGVRDAVQEGVSLINYLGHGSGSGWLSVPFDAADVAALTNTGRLPWIVDVSCSNGNFRLEDCFAETWLRAGTSSAPRGAVAVVSATSDAPWVPPTVMQAEIVDLLTTGQVRSLGALYYGGLMKVLDVYAGLDVARRVFEQNVVFGDCSLQVRTAAPGEFDILSAEVLDENAATWSLRLTAAGGEVGGAVVALTDADKLYGSGIADADGRVTVTLGQTVSGGTQLDVTVSGADMAPWFGVIEPGTGGVSAVEPDFGDGFGDPTPAGRPVLLGNAPNPFNPDTVISFELPRGMRVRLTVHDVRGRRVATLIDGAREAGLQEATWNGRDSDGRTAASGVYLYLLETEDGSLNGRMLLSK